ncbi:S8 family peptidase [Xanthomonas campestris pv. raphani]|uniref:S8 family peptidase n=1 Tax=Xanthomonas campestris TaxID=339 RepID=UPI001E3734C9|nr:S8 family peptidase [Xanthomonas campestris]MEA9769703.1 S8 family peptidase [Xanthomonas campestris pv. raphani]
MPVVRVEFAREDRLNKPGGGGHKKPLIEVTSELRQRLRDELSNVLEQLPTVVRTEGRPGALVVELREAAWAKSNRPNSFLDTLGLPVEAVERVGELVVPIRASQIEDLRARILSASTKIDLFSISTIERFRAWTDDYVFCDPEWHPSQTDGAAPQGRKIRIQLFPWAQLPPELGAMGLVEAPAQSLVDKVLYLKPDGIGDLSELAALPEVRHVDLAPQYATPRDVAPQGFVPLNQDLPASLRELSNEAPIVGVIDSGIADGILSVHVASRTSYEIPPDTDQLHGTFVGGLIVNSHEMNQGDARFPQEHCRVADIAALPIGLVDENVLLSRIEDAVARHPDIRVWNCSFASEQPNHPAQFGHFAAALDRISDQRNVLFVIAAGNYSSSPSRGWPAAPTHYPDDRLAMPGESVRALTVGAVVPFDCLVPAEAPAPYSRRGPGPVFHVKPDVVHYGGGVDSSGNVQGGVRSVLPGDIYAEGVGTSFSTPIVSSIAANAWAAIETAGVVANPSLVKALVVHAAALNSGERSPDDRYYYGHGLPAGSLSSLFCSPDTFTLLFDAELQQGVDWAKDFFPIPSCLRNSDGKLQGEVVITMCYPSPCDFKFGEEYVQHEVELSFGTFDVDQSEDPPKRKQKGKVPPDRPAGLGTREKALLEEGLKYSTSKVYRARFPRGCAGEQWRLKLSLTRRLEVAESVAQRVYVLVSLRGLTPELPVYLEGIKAIPQSWRVSGLVPASRSTTRVQTRS